MTIEVTATDYLGEKRTATVRGASTERLRFNLVPVRRETKVEVVTPAAPTAVSPRPDTPPPPEELPGWRRVLPWALAGGAAVAAGVGVWQHLAWRQKQSDFEAIRGCGADRDMRGSDTRCEGLYNDLTAHRTGAYLGYGVAGALGIGAAVTFILNASADSKEVSFGPGPTALGVSLGGRF